MSQCQEGWYQTFVCVKHLDLEWVNWGGRIYTMELASAINSEPSLYPGSRFLEVNTGKVEKVDRVSTLGQ